MKKKSIKDTSQRKIIFFDLDGTLHKQDIFGSFIFYLIFHLPLNVLLLLLLLPIIGIGLVIKGSTSRWPISLLLWSITFGRTELSLLNLEKKFVGWFRLRMKIFPIVQQKLINYISSNDVDVWVITGSPQSLVEQIYYDYSFFKQINLIASQMERGWGGRILKVRCIGYEKVNQLEMKIGTPLKLYGGYSDNKKDYPLLSFCQKRWLVDVHGKIKKLK
ncbi:phosphatidylglycerophosphatase C [Candidatus Pantoea edessiphila]|uniref:Phosphatidylglycerophosphatase C n=1 Tax=Candidatus Pantoea edessiphila TaxID=2044610 RepID=A0A2P5T2U8_9GAMM|nr:phosphatidylglycerophosphatase C [Candidatus Pantoea edessiphila]PPI88934.1 phosphatidylglycerophosphatase C [Candidatus Pantoea edessiphila]